MNSSRLCFHGFLALFMCFAAANAGWPESFNNLLGYDTIFVDSFGRHGNFLTIQSAIDYIPPNNRNWIRIYIKAGLYREQILIPYDKPFIYMQGEGRRTIVTYDRHDATNTSATFTSLADNIVVKRISFVNSYNYPPRNNKIPVTQALAAMISGDKCAFYRCGFLGLQDTLWDVQGRHYFKLCVIRGGVDFIFGSGQSIYEKCKISVAAATLNGPGYITAQSRSSSAETNGFVFKNCNVSGNGMTFLGRAWGQYARVIYYNCSISNIIVPEGWDAWYAKGHEGQLTFAEYNCSGLGSDTSKRVQWEYKLNDDTVKQLTDISYVDNEGWLSNQPFNMLGI